MMTGDGPGGTGGSDRWSGPAGVSRQGAARSSCGARSPVGLARAAGSSRAVGWRAPPSVRPAPGGRPAACPEPRVSRPGRRSSSPPPILSTGAGRAVAGGGARCVDGRQTAGREAVHPARPGAAEHYRVPGVGPKAPRAFPVAAPGPTRCQRPGADPALHRRRRHRYGPLPVRWLRRGTETGRSNGHTDSNCVIDRAAADSWVLTASTSISSARWRGMVAVMEPATVCRAKYGTAMP